MPLFSKDGGLWKSGINFFKDSGIWKQINILFLKDAGVWKEADTAVSPVNIRFDVYGGNGERFGTNDNGQPPLSAPNRQGGNGGYTRVDMVIPTAYIITPYSFPGGPLPAGGQKGGSSGGFAINGEWMVVVGGGGGAGGSFNYDPTTNSFNSITAKGPGGVGKGGYNPSSPGPSGSSGGTGLSRQSNPAPFFYVGDLGGSGGGGAPGGSGSPNFGNSGAGGSGNIRIWRDQSITSGVLNVNPDWTMTFITSSNGTNNGPARVTITNKDTGGSVNLGGTIPVEDISNL